MRRRERLSRRQFLQAGTVSLGGLLLTQATGNACDFWVHEVNSDHQAGPTEIRVLLPHRMEKDQRYRVLYVLPVEAGKGTRYGDGLLAVQRLGLHNKHDLICVQPTFAHLPWYADHPTDVKVRQESFLLKVVVPFVESKYPVVAGRRGRLLLGFSKSGWGAFSLLLRHPDLFDRAAAWDAPLNKDRPDQFGMGPIFGTQENFENYRITALLEKQAGKLGKEPRLALVGHQNFRAHHQAVHELMERLKIPHEYRDQKLARHAWEAGWVEEAVKFLASRER
jgi:hypothetical protein